MGHPLIGHLRCGDWLLFVGVRPHAPSKGSSHRLEGAHGERRPRSSSSPPREGLPFRVAFGDRRHRAGTAGGGAVAEARQAGRGRRSPCHGSSPRTGSTGAAGSPMPRIGLEGTDLDAIGSRRRERTGAPRRRAAPTTSCLPRTARSSRTTDSARTPSVVAAGSARARPGLRGAGRVRLRQRRSAAARGCGVPLARPGGRPVGAVRRRHHARPRAAAARNAAARARPPRRLGRRLPRDGATARRWRAGGFPTSIASAGDPRSRRRAGGGRPRARIGHGATSRRRAPVACAASSRSAACAPRARPASLDPGRAHAPIVAGGACRGARGGSATRSSSTRGSSWRRSPSRRRQRDGHRRREALRIRLSAITPGSTPWLRELTEAASAAKGPDHVRRPRTGQRRAGLIVAAAWRGH